MEASQSPRAITYQRLQKKCQNSRFEDLTQALHRGMWVLPHHLLDAFSSHHGFLKLPWYTVIF